MRAFLITWVTHNSRVSERMVTYGVKAGEGFWMDATSEQLVTQAIADVVKEDALKVLAYNICGDHVHMVLACERGEMSKIVRKLKSCSSRIHNVALGISTLRKDIKETGGNKGASPLVNDVLERGITQNSLWAQKFHSQELSDEKALSNAVEYVRYNRIKHELAPNHSLHPIIKSMICSYEDAF